MDKTFIHNINHILSIFARCLQDVSKMLKSIFVFDKGSPYDFSKVNFGDNIINAVKIKQNIVISCILLDLKMQCGIKLYDIFPPPDFVPTKSMLAKIILFNFSFSAAENTLFQQRRILFSPELNKKRKSCSTYTKIRRKRLKQSIFGGFDIKRLGACYQNFKKYINPLSIDCQ